MSTRIYTMTHKKFDPPSDPTYIPLQVGRAVNGDLGYLGDDTGENISDLNCYYGELTGIYWLWQNLDYDGNVGVCHYRRFFMNAGGELLTENDYDRMLQEYDVIVSKAPDVESCYNDYYDAYAHAHHIRDLQMTGEVIRELYPEDYPVFDRVMKGRKQYFGNLMVTSRVLFNDYCEWLFTIFAELSGRIDVSSYDAYRKRVFGFLSEQLLLVWTTARRLKVCECRVGFTEEKAETQELKLAIGQLLKQRKIKEARELFYGILEIRPDIRLEQSDIRGEIPLIELILYICECEQERQIEGMLSYSLELADLIAHTRKVRKLLQKGELYSPEQRTYIHDTKVSELMLEVLAINAE